MFVRYLFLVGLIFFILSLAILAFIYLLPQRLWSPAAVLLTPLNPRLSGGGAPCLGEQNLVIDKYWPDQLDLSTSDTIRVLLIRSGQGSFSIATTTTGNHKAAEEKPKFSIDFGTPIPDCGTDLPTALGAANELFATAHLVATTFNIESIGPQERPLHSSNAVDGVEWDWNISPKTLGTQLINIDIDLLWKSKSNGQVVQQVQIWQSHFIIKVVQPFFDSSQLTAGALGSALLGLSGIFASIIAWSLEQISKRRDEGKEGRTKEANKNVDEPAVRPSPPAASLSNLSSSPPDSQTTAVTNAPRDHRGSPSTSVVSAPTQLDELSQRANAYYRDLQIYSREHAPAEWAATQNNLGATLVAQAQLVEGPEWHHLLTQAVTAYRAALEVDTPEGTPTQWAREQSNLGNALSGLAQLAEGSEQHDLLTQAATAYHAALQIYTPEQTSAQWARVLMHLARVQLMMASLENDAEGRCAMLQEASQGMEDILSFFGQEENSVFSQQARQLSRTIQEKIQASGCQIVAESEG
jgi:hypothetical protein